MHINNNNDTISWTINIIIVIIFVIYEMCLHLKTKPDGYSIKVLVD